MSGYITIKQLAEDLGISIALVKKMIRDLEIPCAPITSHTTLIKLSDLDHAMRRAMRRSTEPADPIVERLSKDLDAFLGVA